MLIEVYVCPECGDYYGCTGMPDLSVVNQHTHGINFEVIPKDQWHSRAQCPACRALGKSVERVRVLLDVDLTDALVVARQQQTPVGPFGVVPKTAA